MLRGNITDMTLHICSKLLIYKKNEYVIMTCHAVMKLARVNDGMLGKRDLVTAVRFRFVHSNVCFSKQMTKRGVAWFTNDASEATSRPNIVSTVIF